MVKKEKPISNLISFSQFKKAWEVLNSEQKNKVVQYVVSFSEYRKAVDKDLLVRKSLEDLKSSRKKCLKAGVDNPFMVTLSNKMLKLIHKQSGDDYDKFELFIIDEITKH